MHFSKNSDQFFFLHICTSEYDMHAHWQTQAPGDIFCLSYVDHIVQCCEEGSIGLYIPNDQEISQSQEEISRLVIHVYRVISIVIFS